ncbi:hypothetical protein [Pseudoxanthomonas koreensis]|uniref:hypothetical protein n=1 Tax=Pseudoxanthomonas koreensis TaxID=266061 RepID=UPI00139194FB|nr:hypothetical protein [Pseudoxanthomonas koreensis]KAF1696145.1 hypothetical protein CSC64_02490 [Pseudoxanthomonas koreensis]
MNRRLLWSAVAALVAVGVATPLLAQDTRAGKSAEKAALAEHKAQEQRERDAAAERAKRREAARAGQDTRGKDKPQKEEEEEQRDPR